MAIQTVEIVAPTNLYHEPQYHPGRCICRGTDARIHVVYTDDSGQDLQYVYSDDDGATWSSPELISGSSAYSCRSFAICVDPNDEPVVTYCYYEVTAVRVKRRESGSWSADKAGHNFTKVANTNAALAVLWDHVNDVCHVFCGWRSGSTGTLYHNWSDDDFATWEGSPDSIYSETRNGNIDEDRQYSVCVSADGNVHLAIFRDDGSDMKLSYRKWTSSTTTWGSWEDLETGISASYVFGYAGICTDTSSIPRIVASIPHSGYSYRANIAYYSREGGSWSSVEWFTPQSSVDYSFTLPAIDDDNQLWLLRGRHESSVTTFYIQYRTGASTWDVTSFTVPGWVHGLLWAGSTPYGRCASGYYTTYVDTTGTDSLDLRYDDATVFGEDSGAVPVSASDGITFAELAERYSVAAAQAEGVEFSESASEVAELNVGTPIEGITFAEYAGVILSVEAADAIEFGELASRAYAAEAADGIEFGEDARRLNFAKEGIEFGELASAVVVIQVEASDGITFEEGAAHLPLEGCETEYEPSPAIQADPNALTKTFLLGPWATLANVIQLPRPEYGDVRRNRVQVITHRTRGGALRAYKRTPTYRSLVLVWTGLSRRKLLELEAFLEATAAEDVRFIDHEGRTWRGKVLNTTIDLVTEGPDVGEAAIEFEGVTVSS